MAMHNPPHPGEFIGSVYLEPNGISGRELAAKLGVAASTLSRVLKGSSSVSPRDGVAFVESSRTFAGKLARIAVPVRPVACPSTRGFAAGWQGAADGGVTNGGRPGPVASRVPRRIYVIGAPSDATSTVRSGD